MPVRGGSILREVWFDIEGTAISQLTEDPRFPEQPSETNLVTDLFEAPVDIAENYGQRMHGYLVPPQSGNYTFWIATDDAGELWLSTDENPANRKLIASVSGWTSPREWGKEANQESPPVRLEANRAYYVAALQKEGAGGDNLAVRWFAQITQMRDRFRPRISSLGAQRSPPPKICSSLPMPRPWKVNWRRFPS